MPAGRSVAGRPKGVIFLREGTGELAANEKRKDPAPMAKPEKRGGRGKKEGHVGNALRSVYQETVAEDVPPEMLDLLGKLT